MSALTVSNTNQRSILHNGERSNLDSSSQSSHSTEEEITNAELGLAEDHFSLSEGHFGLSSTEELEMVIESCREMILATQEKSEKRKNLVKKLVNLRMKLQELREEPEVVPPDVCLLLGHRFEKQQVKRPKVKRFCEKCCGNIWGVVHSWYQCQYCRFRSHGKCLNFITRVCASKKVQDDPSYCLQISPEVGLARQRFRCAECRTPVMHTNSTYIEPRLCDYNGEYYCPNCHWNSLMVIPARVMHNWDFEPRRVCRSSKQFLQLMKKKAVLNVQIINPMLYTFVDELKLVKSLRDDILLMKTYFLSCKDALESKLLLQLSARQHFVDSSEMYSIQDLEDVESGALIEFLTVVHSNYSKHIKEDCQICKGKGYFCEFCNSGEIIYPFDKGTTRCDRCSSVFHTECFYQRKDQACPKCQRILEIKLKQKDENTQK